MNGLISKIAFFVFCMLSIPSYGNISIPFELINGLIIVEAEINGAAGSYIIDSGSNGILLNGSSQESNVSYQTLTSTLEGSETKIESFKVGDFEVNELHGFSTDLSNLEVYLDKSIAGILGCSIFTPNSILFDFSASTMIISEQDSKAIETEGFANLSFDIIDDLPIVELNIQGEDYTFILDSGASSHFVDADLLDTHSDILEPTGVQKSIVTAGGKDQMAKEYFLHNIKIGDSSTTLSAFEKDFSLVSSTLGKDISGLLSLSKLSSGLVYIDLKSNKLFYEVI